MLWSLSCGSLEIKHRLAYRCGFQTDVTPFGNLFRVLISNEKILRKRNLNQEDLMTPDFRTGAGRLSSVPYC